MATKMATVDRVEELLEKLRSASWDHAVQGTVTSCISSELVGLMLLFASSPTTFLICTYWAVCKIYLLITIFQKQRGTTTLIVIVTSS